MATEKIPLVSVIIPMYNSARFIPQTLESLLGQTMQDFEVVVIDDCSTDNSVEVVESFAEKFAAGGGIKLNVIKLPENSGAPGTPRNVGIQFARGKYIAFLDSDDLYTKTALEELSGLAKEFQADVVHTDTFFLQYSEENLEVCQRQALPVVSEPTFETNDFALRIRQWVNRGYNWESVTNFCRRDFLTANQILFPELRNYEDMIFSFAALCFAEKFLRVPNLTYVYRQRLDSITHENYDDVSAPIHKYLVILKDGFHAFERIMRAFSFFEKRIDYRYAVLNFYFNDVWHSTYPLYMENPPFVLNDFVRNEFHFDDSALSSYLFDMVNIYRLQILQLQQENVKLKKFQK